MHSYVDILQLKTHDDGGYYSQFYKSSDKVISLSHRFEDTLQSDSTKNPSECYAGSSIYYLLENEASSALHRLKSDEIWHYYDGTSAVNIDVISQNGQVDTYVLGNPNITKDASFQVAIKAGTWFTAKLQDKSSFSLVGCTVSPAFKQDDFELAESHSDPLEMQYPKPHKIPGTLIKPNTAKSSEKISHHFDLKNDNGLNASDYIKKFNSTAKPPPMAV